jgi:hypothetical protein
MVAIAALALAAPAAAQQPSDKLDRGHGMFFNRPGGTLDAALADTRRPVAPSPRVRSRRSPGSAC